MNINVLVMALLATIIGLYTWKAYLHQGDPPPNQLPWVPIDANKPRSFVNKTSDAGLYIERVRRTAIIGNPSGNVSYKGSTNGSLEWNFLTSICVCPPRKVCPTVFELSDGGYYNTEVCDVLDGMGTDVADFGNAFTETCAGVCPPAIYETQEGGNVNTEVCNVFDGQGTDVADFGGAADANVC